MSRLTIDMTPQQHQALKAMAALEGKTIKQYTLERLFPRGKAAGDAAPVEVKSAAPRSPASHSDSWPPLDDEHAIDLDTLFDKNKADMTADERAAFAELTALLEERIALAQDESRLVPGDVAFARILARINDKTTQ